MGAFQTIFTNINNHIKCTIKYLNIKSNNKFNKKLIEYEIKNTYENSYHYGLNLQPVFHFYPKVK